MAKDLIKDLEMGWLPWIYLGWPSVITNILIREEQESKSQEDNGMTVEQKLEREI